MQPWNNTPSGIGASAPSKPMAPNPGFTDASPSAGARPAENLDAPAQHAAADVPPPTAGAEAAGLPAPSKGRVFLHRLSSAVVLWGLVLLAVFVGQSLLAHLVFLGILTLLVWVGLGEFYALAHRVGLACFDRLGRVGGALLIVATFCQLHGWLGLHDSPARVNDFETSLLILFVLGLCLRQLAAGEPSRGLEAVATTLFGLLYVAWLLNFLQKVFFFPKVEGRLYVLYFILVTKCSDTGAYLVGTWCGRHKLVPRLSPAKSWEGFAGALLLAVLASVVFAQAAGPRLAGMSLGHAIALGLILGLAAVAGDLIESLFKRQAGLKDSGRLFPGIGGLLDLLDSLMFNAPLMYVYLRHVLTRP